MQEARILSFLYIEGICLAMTEVAGILVACGFFFMAFIPIFGYCEVFVKNLGDFQCLKDMKFGRKDDKTEYSYFTGMSKI